MSSDDIEVGVMADNDGQLFVYKSYVGPMLEVPDSDSDSNSDSSDNDSIVFDFDSCDEDSIQFEGDDDTCIFAFSEDDEATSPGHLRKPWALKEFESEISIMPTLNHPNVVRYLPNKALPSADMFVFTMEYCPTGDLYTYLRSLSRFQNETRSLESSEQIKFVMGISKGLCYLHDQNVLHLDIKSENIYITTDGTAKIGDFGKSVRLDLSAEAAAEAALDSKVLSNTVFSPLYCPPEARALPCRVSKASDIFAYGLVLAEIIESTPNFVLLDRKTEQAQYGIDNGENYYKEVLPNVAERIEAQQDGDAVCAEASVAEKQFKREVAALIKLCWNSSPTKRPSAEKILECVEHFDHDDTGSSVKSAGKR